ncbi:hypothetical protein M0R19_08890 [Candidatus Pacearchaeota archaeon]|jgi:hypothetical protein|nr:hypothetical protein [Candidatus Pacearchaeota archaeon]
MGSIHTTQKKLFWVRSFYCFVGVGLVILCSWILMETFNLMAMDFIINYKLSCIIIAPLIEEYAKRIFLKKGYPYLFTFIFGFIEFFLYLYSYMIKFHDITFYFMFRRLLCVGMHYLYMLIQKKSSEEGYDLTGYFLGSFAHAIQNFLAVAQSIGV